ncbi:response regulator [Alteribacillus sp. JSM 102045]|uniref:response regulator transcription factor n=1 Tax=Alteribacillus sp. JSM 102045 TaxID=1562101 RepID=UPI0035BF9E61
MKVLIAEDEILERKAMCKFIEDHFKDITIAGEAVNGRMAIELANETSPDIILMDIKMPGINGIEAIEKIKQQHPYIQFILVSAYDSFEYAKQAMKLGVKEYILKPGKKEETIEAIQRVRKEADHLQKEMDQLSHHSELAKQLLLSKVMNEEADDEVMRLKKELFPDMASAFFLVISHENHQAFTLKSEHVQQWTTDTVIGDHETGRQIILLCIGEKQQNLQEVRRLKKRIQRECGGRLVIGSGHPVQKIENLFKCYYEALMDKQSLKTKNRETDDKRLLEVITAAVLSGDEQDALSHMMLLLEQRNAKTQCEELYYVFKQTFHLNNVAMPVLQLNELQTDQDWYAFIRQAFLNARYHYQSLDKIERAKKYIDEHVNEAISLEEIAEYTDLSPAYFSNLFKETLGENFIDYVTKRRIEKATAMMKEQAYTLKEISFTVGYKDPNYFSRVFKKYYGLSPKQYQKQTLKK